MFAYDVKVCPCPVPGHAQAGRPQHGGDHRGLGEGVRQGQVRRILYPVIKMQIEIMKIDGPEEKQYCEEKLSHRSPPGHKARPRVLLTIISRGKVGDKTLQIRVWVSISINYLYLKI